MASTGNLRRRLVAGLSGALLVGSLLAGAVSVAADNDDVIGHSNVETNQGADGIGVVKDTTLTINSVVAPSAVSGYTPAAPAQDLPVASPNIGRDDNQ